MELDNEYELLVNRRKAWERSYHDSIRRMDNAKQNLKLIDIRLERIREDKVTAKANRLEPVLDEDGKVVNDGFEMTFSNGKTFTKRDAAGNQLHFDMQMKCVTRTKTCDTGYLSWFRIENADYGKTIQNGYDIEIKYCRC
ncbi:Uncharacterised protein [Streptococcus hyointestinalis]|uniref:Uncharacterized protein n=1 Tax=Streptococcus hyointestinalis TaxID=1337 RepID=A0A380K086_9STRE|nr:hypothetical protein [Streptococcus hyointestinalis]SUN58219.1 Uncharacterised protein [Streptococcus hyointestinalis]